MKRTYHSSFILILYAFSCISNASSISDKNFIQIEFQDSKVMKKTLNEFMLQNIPYKRKNNRIILIKNNESKKALKITDNIFQNTIPTNRSINYNKTQHTIFINKLKKKNIPFKIVEYGDLAQTKLHKEQGITTKWVVWPEKYTTSVKQIQIDLQSEILNRLNNSEK